MSVKISRRKFFVLSLVSGLSLYVGGWWLLKVRPQDTDDIVIAILKKHVGYLKVAEADMVRFASEIQEKFPDEKRSLVSWLGMITLLYKGIDFAKMPVVKDNFRKLEELVVGNFLLSTDFFWNGADESKEVKYLGLYRDPKLTPCPNPLARFD